MSWFRGGALLLMAALGGCVALGLGSAVSTPPDDQLQAVRVVVLANGSEGERVAEKLRQAGYVNVSTDVGPSRTLGIKFGGTSNQLADHVAMVTGDAIGVAAGRIVTERVAGPGPPEVFIHLDMGAVCAAKPDCSAPPGLTVSAFHGLVEIRVFADSKEGVSVATAIRKAGYLIVELEETPNEDLNIKYGAAPAIVVDELVRIMAEQLGVEPRSVRRLPIFEADNDDIYVNAGSIAVATARGELPEAGSLQAEVVVFADAGPVAERVVARLRAEGIDRVETTSDPGTQLRVALCPRLGPLGGRFQTLIADELGVRPDAIEVRDDAKVPAGTVFVHLPGARVPPSCGFSPATADFGSFEVGTRVTLGRHRVIGGSDNWSDGMEPWVGREATVTALDGVDPAGCPVVRVDVDRGEFGWRVRDLSR